MAERRTRERERVDRERNRELAGWLARERWDALVAIARRYGVRAELAGDVVQSALVGVLRAFPGPDEREAVYRYAARCVQNEALRAHRRYARKESHECSPPEEPTRNDRVGTRLARDLVDAGAADPAEVWLGREADLEGREVLLSLPPTERAVLVLRATGFAPAEIAKLLGLSHRAVRKRVTRANRLLRELAK